MRVASHRNRPPAMRHVVIIGAGVGGLAAAARLAGRGCRVTLCEARDRAGGLAGPLECDGFRFDAGPYILLDRPGLEWAFARLGSAAVPALDRVTDVYEAVVGGESVRFHADLDETADGFERRWPGSGSRYRRLIRGLQARYARLQPLQVAAPGWKSVLRLGAWRDVPFLLRSLDRVLGAARLPEPVVQSLSIWTHVAGQTVAAAPAPLALVPAVIHGVGAYYPRGGIGAIVAALETTARNAGATLRFGSGVRRIRCPSGVARGVELDGGEVIDADAVLSNVGLGTYLGLLDDEGRSALGATAARGLGGLPLQSPGVCAYLAVRGPIAGPYLRFRLTGEPDGCRLLVMPGVLGADRIGDGWFPARLIAPLDHGRATAGGEEFQNRFLDRVLAEDWWRRHVAEARVLARRIPRDWGAAFRLHADAMNPVMTPQFMRAGRLPHRSPVIPRLFLAGSATHPGQWVSFACISGVLAADRVLESRFDRAEA
jgi:phytoene desaturase